jgi:hypothetical protein
MRSVLLVVAVIAAAFSLDPATAHAQGYLTPSLGVTFGNPSAQGRADFVADLGWIPRTEPLGVELDVTYAPSFFGNQGPYGQNSVTTVMGNVVLAGGGGGRSSFFAPSRSATRPYVSGGIGILHEVVTTPLPVNKISNNDLGLNLGFGLMAFTRRPFGVRGDLRYFRDLVNNGSGNTANIDFGSFHFWRAGIGVIFAF